MFNDEISVYSPPLHLASSNAFFCFLDMGFTYQDLLRFVSGQAASRVKTKGFAFTPPTGQPFSGKL
jgi:hypothetical protein